MQTNIGALKHSNFVRLIAATPADSKQVLTIQYDLGKSPFGPMFVAATSIGVCRASFIIDESNASELQYLHSCWPNAQLEQNNAWAQEQINHWFGLKKQILPQVCLHLVGTPFQQDVWQALLDIPLSQTISYAQLAVNVNRPKAFRAVGTAAGANPVAFLIPCHRVLQKNGGIGGYFWGLDIKRALIEWEAK